MAADSRKPVVLVTDAGKGCALAVIRSLGRLGYRVIATDADSGSPGFASRHAFATEVYPNPSGDTAAYCDCMLRIVREYSVDLVIPATDWTVQPLARERGAFRGLTQLAIAETDALNVTTRKPETLRLARRIGVPVPETRVIRSVAEALTAAPELGWPLVLKPQSSHHLDDESRIEKLQVEYAASEADLRPKVARLVQSCPVMLQRYFAGEGRGVSMLTSDGHPLAAFEHRRLHEVPVTGGASSYRESAALDPTRYDYAARLLRELRWTGLAMVEFKVGPERSELMEINGRVWGSLPLGVASGVDFPGLLARLYLEGSQSIAPQIDGQYRVGVRCRNLGSDVLWIAQTLAQRTHHPFLAVPRRSRALPALLGMLNPRNKMDLQCVEDPLPGVLELAHIARKLWRKFRQSRTADSESMHASGQAR